MGFEFAGHAETVFLRRSVRKRLNHPKRPSCVTVSFSAFRPIDRNTFLHTTRPDPPP
jgi:hypothetical protein